MENVCSFSQELDGKAGLVGTWIWEVIGDGSICRKRIFRKMIYINAELLIISHLNNYWSKISCTKFSPP